MAFDHLPRDFISAPGVERRSPAILEAPDKTAWNKAKAARLLCIVQVSLYRKIKKYNLTKSHDQIGHNER
ncbi:MAG: helix-turn-helix domain-containing protein [Syntrophobacteraceae bacterium]